VPIIFSRRASLVLALSLLWSFGPSRRCSGGNSPDSQNEIPVFFSKCIPYRICGIKNDSETGFS
jgi:hypothetical protein